jgi:hypothetical protein
VLENHREDRTRAARARRSSRADAGRRKRAASKRWSTRNFGEYAFLEDSRYASQAENARGKNSQTVARVNGSELGKSAPSTAHPTHEVVDPPLEFTPRGPRRDANAVHLVTGTDMNGDFARMRDRGDIGTVVNA